MIIKKNNSNGYAQLSDNSIKEIKNCLSKFPEDKKRSAIMPALTIVQKQNNGYLNRNLIDNIANYLNIPKIEVYEVATFYSMYEMSKVGKYKICICTNISCMLNGCNDIVKYIKDKFNIGFGQITKDEIISLKEVECLGACGSSPVLQINDVYYENMNVEKLNKILSKLI